MGATLIEITMHTLFKVNIVVVRWLHYYVTFAVLSVEVLPSAIHNVETERGTDQDCSENRGANAFSHFVLALLIGPGEVVLSSRAKHSETQKL